MHLRWLVRDVTERKRWQDRILNLTTELEFRVSERTSQLQQAYARERRVAEVLQRRLLESVEETEFKGLRLSTSYLPATDDLLVGGDFYDAFSVCGGRVALVVGDVSGKGLDAASRTAEIKYVLRGLLMSCPSALSNIGQLNTYLCSNSRDAEHADYFVTLCLAIFDPETGMVSVTSAGAERAIISRAGGEIETIDLTGLPLGVFADAAYEAQDVKLEIGDRLIMHTDGIIEARRDGTMLGADGVQALIAGSRQCVEVGHAVAGILAGARSFTGGALQDDACVLIAERS